MSQKMEGKRFTPEELAAAKSTDLTAVASALGYTVKRIGRFHTLEEMDSIRIYDRTSWFRWSRKDEKGNNGGSQIDFLRVFAGMSVREAVSWLLDFSGYRRDRPWENAASCACDVKKEERKKPFILPAPSASSACMYAYLIRERRLDRHVVDYFAGRGLIYEERSHHNIVFKGNDAAGNTRSAGMRGTSDRGGRPFKCDVAGSDKNYGFNIWDLESSEVLVFEAAIDLMSCADIYAGCGGNMLALGMLSDAPLATFLKEHPGVKSISFCLDNDRPGRKAAAGFMEKYRKLGYAVRDSPPPEQFKDYNEWLQKAGACISAGKPERGMPR